MTLALARTFAPNLGKVEKRVKPDGTVEVIKLSGLRGIGHAGLTSKYFKEEFILINLFPRFWSHL